MTMLALLCVPLAILGLSATASVTGPGLASLGNAGPHGFRRSVGRYFVIVPVLAVAGSLAAKQIVPRSAGTLPTGGSLFVMFLVGVICIVGGHTFLPAFHSVRSRNS